MTTATRKHVAPVLLGTLLLAGCGAAHIHADRAALDGAPKPQAWDGNITVSTQPVGASCIVMRDGARVAAFDSTPGVVSTLARSNSRADITCNAPGRLETTVAVYPLRDFGRHHHQPTGPAGAVNHREDLQSGRVRRFYDVTVALPPAAFSSAETRDAWFAGQAQAIRSAWAVHIGRAERSSAATMDTADTLRGYMNQDLAALERQRAQTTIVTTRNARR